MSLLSLINKGRAFLEEVGDRQGFGTFVAEFLTAVTRDHSGVVVVLKVEHIPTFAIELGLPFRKGSLQFSQIERNVIEIGKEAVGLLRGKLNHHIEHGIVVLVDVFKGFFRGVS